MVKSAVIARIGVTYPAYAQRAAKLRKTYEDKCKRQAALVEAAASIVLALPFFYAADFVGKAVAGAITKSVPMIAQKLAITEDAVKEAMKTMLVPASLQKTVEEAFKEGKKGMSKDIAGGSAAEVMVNYASAVVNSIPELAYALSERVQQMNDIGAVAAIYSAVEMRTPSVFEDELKKHLSLYESQVAPTYDFPSVSANIDTGGSTVVGRKIALVTIGTETYRAQVSETTSSEPLVSHSPHYGFVCWVELMEDAPDESSSRIVRVQGKDIEDLPPGTPPATARA